MNPSRSVTELLVEWGNGNRAALEELAPYIYGELRTIARAYLRRGRNVTLQPTVLLHEAFLRLIGESHPIRWEGRAHFFGFAAHAMRLVLVDYARARNAAKRGGGAQRITLEETQLLAPAAPDVIDIDMALEQLARVRPRPAEAIELRYFGGLSLEESAAALGVSVATVKTDLRFGEAWLRRFLSGRKPSAAC